MAGIGKLVKAGAKIASKAVKKAPKGRSVNKMTQDLVDSSLKKEGSAVRDKVKKFEKQANKKRRLESYGRHLSEKEFHTSGAKKDKIKEAKNKVKKMYSRAKQKEERYYDEFNRSETARQRNLDKRFSILRKRKDRKVKNGLIPEETKYSFAGIQYSCGGKIKKC